MMRSHRRIGYLLRPKAGGLAFVLDAMGDALHAILDVTIVYPEGPCTMMDLIAGRVHDIRVHVRELPINDELRGDYEGDAVFRAGFQTWVNTLWSEKDMRIGRMLDQPLAQQQEPQRCAS